MELPDNYEPEPGARVWYRCAQTGQLGWFVQRKGQPKFKYDRPGREILKPFNKYNFIPCDNIRKLTDFHVGHITFEADRVLCKILGKHSLAKKDWDLLRDKQRQEWIAVGPEHESVERRLLYNAIKQVMIKIEDEKNSTKINS